MDSNFTIRSKEAIKEIMTLYLPMQHEIESRLDEFSRIWKTGKEKDIFAELVFCLLTPQSKAQSCDSAMKRLFEEKLLFKGDKTSIAKTLRGKVRFHNTKAINIVEARKVFTKDGTLSIKPLIGQFTNAHDTREWLEKNVRGLGFKEAGHFLRNIGLGEELAILDRHILKNLKKMGVIGEVPTSLSKKKYFKIEKKMEEFAKRAEIPMAHLDLLLWYKETGEVFK